MASIIIYDAEKEAGLESDIRSKSSIAYASPLCPATDFDPSVLASYQQNQSSLLSDFSSKAGKDDDDIYHTYSILVTTSWNKNDDVFPKDSVWASRNTPKFKPANLEHDEKKIVGGIIGSWPVNGDFELIDESSSIEQLPDNYHILVSSVIYRQWQDAEYQARAEALIEKIEQGNMFVSMECIFRGFDYAVQTPTNENHIVARGPETAFLTKHLKAYGGGGEYQGHKVGRLLRSITFSGKGFVEKPANPESIIFDKKHLFSFANASESKNLFSRNNGVSLRVEHSILSNVEPQEEKNLMSNDFLNDQVKELKTALVTAEAENKELIEQLSQAGVEKLEKRVAELSQELQESNESLASAEADLAEAHTSIETLKVKAEEEAEARKVAEAAIATLEEEKKRESRVSALIEAGISEDEVESKLETFASLSDEQFEEVVSTIASMQTSTEETVETDNPIAEAEETEEEAPEVFAEDSEASEEIDTEVLDTADAEDEADLAVSSDEPEESTAHVRDSLRSWVSSYVFDSTNE